MEISEIKGAIEELEQGCAFKQSTRRNARAALKTIEWIEEFAHFNMQALSTEEIQAKFKEFLNTK